MPEPAELRGCPFARRSVLLVGAGAAVAGCGVDEPALPGPAAGGTATAGPTGTPGRLAAVGAVPVGGGTAVDGGNVLLTQPRAGVFKGYDAHCTHAGGMVQPPDAEGVAVCPVHGARFRAADGAVLSGPAPRALAAISVKVEGGFVVRA